MSAEILLRRPIKAHNEELTEITLREPTTKEIIEIGQPMLMIIGEDGKSTGIEIRQRIAARWICKLAAIPMSSVESMLPVDFSKCVAAVMGFFGAGDGETEQEDSPTGSSTSPTSGG